MKVSRNDAESIDGVVRMLTDRSIRPSKGNEVELVKWTSSLPSHVIDSIDGYLSTIKAKTLATKFDEMKRKGKPTNRKELPIGGRDVMDLGYRGQKIGKVLDWAMEYSIRNGGQSREELIKIIKKGI